MVALILPFNCTHGLSIPHIHQLSTNGDYCILCKPFCSCSGSLSDSHIPTY
jgi:hypothetical protein